MTPLFEESWLNGCSPHLIIITASGVSVLSEVQTTGFNSPSFCHGCGVGVGDVCGELSAAEVDGQKIYRWHSPNNLKFMV
jgi:hypothetical protein